MVINQLQGIGTGYSGKVRTKMTKRKKWRRLRLRRIRSTRGCWIHFLTSLNSTRTKTSTSPTTSTENSPRSTSSTNPTAWRSQIEWKRTTTSATRRRCTGTWSTTAKPQLLISTIMSQLLFILGTTKIKNIKIFLSTLRRKVWMRSLRISGLWSPVNFLIGERE